MYYPKLKKLKDINVSDDLIKAIDKILGELETESRISPFIFTRLLGIPKDKSLDIVFYCAELGIIKIEYEITCPECSSDVLKFSSLREISRENVRCDVCGETFTPTEKDIWLIFSLIEKPRYKFRGKVRRAVSGRLRVTDVDENPFFLGMVDDDFFRIDRDTYCKLLEGVEKARTNVEKKKALEDLAEHLFENISGCKVVARNKRSRTSELDLIIENNNVFHPFLKELGFHFVVECKNWSASVGCNEIRDFGRDLEKRRIRFGILISKKGITGDPEQKNAAGENLITILRKKYLDLRFI